MKTVLVLIFISFSFNALGEKVNRCFYDHVKDAIVLNKIRKPLYAKLTHNKSLKVSRYLILWERLITLKARKYDKKALEFQKLGIPFMCEDFVDMRLTPEFKPYTAEIPKPYLNKYSPKTKSIKKDLKTSLKINYQAFKKKIENEIFKLEKNDSYDCLLRHLLESLLRTADLAPRYLKKASIEKRPKLKKLINKYLKLQIFGISQAVFIDKKARSIQASGIPILCNDVPYVELSPW